jgi:acetylornithine/succinyldiaminopimelate/putrescine aminotransferase
LQDSYPNLIEGVRGRGLLLGIKLKIAPIDFVQKGREAAQAALMISKTRESLTA